MYVFYLWEGAEKKEKYSSVLNREADLLSNLDGNYTILVISNSRKHWKKMLRFRYHSFDGMSRFYQKEASSSVKASTPTEGCCTLVRTIGMQCVCEVITKGMEATIDMQKLVNVAAACGCPLAPGSQCGSNCKIIVCLYILHLI